MCLWLHTPENISLCNYHFPGGFKERPPPYVLAGEGFKKVLYTLQNVTCWCEENEGLLVNIRSLWMEFEFVLSEVFSVLKNI